MDRRRQLGEQVAPLTTPILLLAISLSAALLAGFAWLRRATGLDDGDQSARIYRLAHPSTEPAKAGAPMRILIWNIHYAAGPEEDLFEPRSRDQVVAQLDALVAAIKAQDPDIVLLQETDLGAARTHHIDQARYIADAAGYPHYATAQTWSARYIPYPPRQPRRWLGSMSSGQALLSRYPILRNHRRALSQPADNPFWYNWFYLHRCVQLVELAVDSGPPFQLFNLHFEAFSVANRHEHADQLAAFVAETSGPDGRFVVAGDFNAVPPEANLRHGFVDEPETDMRSDQTIATLRSTLSATDTLESHPVEEERHGFSFPALAPNRRLDYSFVGRGVRALDYGLCHEPAPVSDHLAQLLVASLLELPRKDNQ